MDTDELDVDKVLEWKKPEKVYFPAKRLALVVINRPKGITHFYLSIGLSKKG